MKKDICRRATAAFCLPVLLTCLVSAQQFATVNVAVTDPSGNAISEARITLQNKETSAKRSELSSGVGSAVIPGLPAGAYQLTVESEQFRSFEATLVLSVGQNASVPVTLGIKTTRETVDVQETVQGIDTQKSEVSQVIDTAKIADLPISGGDFIDFVLLTPSANVGRSTSVGAQSPFQETVLELSFAGLRETHSAFFALDAPNFLGPVPRTFGDGVTSPANPTFGTPNYVSPARQIQMSLRLNF